MPRLPELLHVGHVVPDAAAAIAELQRDYGLAEIRRLDLDVSDALVRGERQSFRARYAFVGFGNTEWELIEPLAGVSPYSLFLAEHGPGVHHLAFVVDSIDEHLAHLRETTPGLSLLVDAQLPEGGGRFVYVEGTAQGAVLELIERA